MNLKVMSKIIHVPEKSGYGFHTEAYDETKIGFVNETGAWVVQPQYDYAEEFSEGLAKVVDCSDKHDIKFYFINENNGKRIWVCNAASVRSFNNGFAVVQQKSDYKWGLIDHTGKLVCDYKYFNEKDVTLDNLTTICKSVEDYGTCVLNWVSPEIFANNDYVNLIKVSVKNHLKNIYDDSMTKEAFTDIISKEKAEFESIKDSKIHSIAHEKETKHKSAFSIIDEIIK